METPYWGRALKRLAYAAEKTPRQSSTISFYFVFAPYGTGLERVTEVMGEASSRFLGSGIDLLDHFLELGSGFELAESPLVRRLSVGLSIRSK
jgi:hypothetical protein